MEDAVTAPPITASADCKWVAINALTIAEEFQCRERCDSGTVSEYAEFVETAGGEWAFDTPCEVVAVKQQLILVDGFHRVRAMAKAGEDQVYVRVTAGSRTDALRAALRANRSHGLRRSNKDKRRTVMMALKSPVISKWSDRKIANECGLSHPFVASIRAELESVTTSAETEKCVGDDGKTYPATKADADRQREKIADAIENQPGASNRQIAREIGCDDKTVSSVRFTAACEAPATTAQDEPEQEMPDSTDLKRIEKLCSAVSKAILAWPASDRAEALHWVREVVKGFENERVG